MLRNLQYGEDYLCETLVVFNCFIFSYIMFYSFDCRRPGSVSFAIWPISTNGLEVPVHTAQSTVRQMTGKDRGCPRPAMRWRHFESLWQKQDFWSHSRTSRIIGMSKDTSHSWHATLFIKLDERNHLECINNL